MTDSLFFELLQVAIGNRTSLSLTPTPEQWEAMYVAAKRHTLVGIAFAGVERLPQPQLPPPRRIRQWAVKAERIRTRNLQATADSVKAYKYFVDHGFKCLILKGQGNTSYYPPHLKPLRTPGDVDVWIWPATNGGHHPIKRAIEFCLTHKKGEYIYYHNLDLPLLPTSSVEVHYRPSWLYNPIKNRLLSRFFTSYRHSATPFIYEGYAIPDPHFNVVFQLLHLYKHIFEEGIGLRQMLDYYLLLRSVTDAKEQMPLLDSLGLGTFAGAVMHVLHEVFDHDNDNSWMLCSPNAKAGDTLLKEIMLSGNFGQYDQRYRWAEVTNGSLKYRGLSYAFTRLRHNLRFLNDYTGEVLWEPFFRIYNKFWILLRLWRFE